MKRLFAGLLCSVLLATGVPALAAQNYTVEVEGNVLDLTAVPYEENDRVMLPLRAVAEALGFTITWEQKTKTAYLDNGTLSSSAVIGSDQYAIGGDPAEGSTSAQSFGAPPALVEGVTYVPSEFFTLLCGHTTVKDGKVSIRMERQTQTPNPMVTYPDLTSAAKALGFAISAPATLPDGFSLDSVWVIGGTLLELRYQSGENTASFRMAAGAEDVSGDFTRYESTIRQPAKHTEFVLKGNGDTVSLVLWTEGDYTYSISFHPGVVADTAVAMAESVKAT